MYRIPKLVFVVFSCVSLVAAFGCFRQNADPVAVSSAGGEESTPKTTVVHFRFAGEDGSSRIPKGSIMADVLASVTIRLHLIDVAQKTKTTLVRTVPVVNRVASATFTSVPVVTALGEIEIIGGKKDGHTLFRGAADLKAVTENEIVVDFVGANSVCDAIAQALASITADPDSFAKLVASPSERLQQMFAQLPLNTPNPGEKLRADYLADPRPPAPEAVLTVAFESPASGTVFNPSSTTLEVVASASASGSAIVKVEYFLDGSLAGEDTLAPFTHSFPNPGMGWHEVAAKVTAGNGQTAEKSITVVVDTPPDPPAISLGASFGPSASPQVLFLNPEFRARNFSDPDTGEFISNADLQIFDSDTYSDSAMVWKNSGFVFSGPYNKDVLCPVNNASGSFLNSHATFSRLTGFSHQYYAQARFYDRYGVPGTWTRIPFKTDGGPGFQWSKMFGENSYDTGLAIARIGNAAFILGGTQGTSASNGLGFHGYLAWCLKLGETGEKLAETFLGSKNTESKDVEPIDALEVAGTFKVLLTSKATSGDLVGDGNNHDLAYVFTLDPNLAQSAFARSSDIYTTRNLRYLSRANRLLPRTDGTLSVIGHYSKDSPIEKGIFHGRFQNTSCVEYLFHKNDADVYQVGMGGCLAGTECPMLVGWAKANDTGNEDLLLKYFPEETSDTGHYLKHVGAGDEKGYDIVQVSEGEYLVLGQAEGATDFPEYHGGKDLFLARVGHSASDGFTVRWVKCLGGSGDDVPIRLKVLPDGGVLVLATTNSKAVSPSAGYIPDISPQPSLAWVIKVDASGNPLWSKILVGALGSRISDAVVGADGGLLLVGSTTDDFPRPDGTSDRASGGMDLWVVKLFQ